MPINQREVYRFPHPTEKVDDHLFIILSVNDANIKESTAIGVMITSSETRKDDFSFDLTDAMFEKPLAKTGSHARMHLIALVLQEQMSSNCVNKMRKAYFDQLMKSIGDIVFNFDFTPF